MLAFDNRKREAIASQLPFQRDRSPGPPDRVLGPINRLFLAHRF